MIRSIGALAFFSLYACTSSPPEPAEEPEAFPEDCAILASRIEVYEAQGEKLEKLFADMSEPPESGRPQPYPSSPPLGGQPTPPPKPRVPAKVIQGFEEAASVFYEVVDDLE